MTDRTVAQLQKDIVQLQEDITVLRVLLKFAVDQGCGGRIVLTDDDACGLIHKRLDIDSEGGVTVARVTLLRDLGQGKNP